METGQLGETNQNRRNKHVTEMAFVRRVINLVPRLQPRSQGLSSSRPLEQVLQAPGDKKKRDLGNEVVQPLSYPHPSGVR